MEMLADPVENQKFHDLFTSSLGKEVLDILDRDFSQGDPYHPGTDMNVNDTIFYLGSQAVVREIHRRMDAHIEMSKVPVKPKRREGDYL